MNLSRRKTELEIFLLKKITKAFFDYDMVSDGDRILVGVSGGKDSLSLIRLLKIKQKQSLKKYDLIAAHVNFGYPYSQLKIEELKEFLENLGVAYHIEFAELPAKNDGSLSDCFWCSWNRRKILFNLAKRYGCNKIALAHHMDDIIETFLMNIFFYGEISTMPAKMSLFEGELFIIRPLVYVKEEYLRKYAQEQNFPVSLCQCPYFNNSRRKLVEELIAELEKKYKDIKINLFSSMKRIKTEYLV